MTDQTETATTSFRDRGWPPGPEQGAQGRALDQEFIAALRRGDEDAFELLLDRLSPVMLGVARAIVSNHETAEEIVQDTWHATIVGLDRFEGRSSLKTWILSILTNLARTRAKRECRVVPFSSVSDFESPADMLAAMTERVSSERHAWMLPRSRRKQTPEDGLLSQELVAVVQRALQLMPARQAEVVTLRDVEGWSAYETCQALGLSESNQKVLLHRGRTKVRHAIDAYRGSRHDVADAGSPQQSRYESVSMDPARRRGRAPALATSPLRVSHLAPAPSAPSHWRLRSNGSR